MRFWCVFGYSKFLRNFHKTLNFGWLILTTRRLKIKKKPTTQKKKICGTREFHYYFFMKRNYPLPFFWMLFCRYLLFHSFVFYFTFTGIRKPFSVNDVLMLYLISKHNFFEVIRNISIFLISSSASVFLCSCVCCCCWSFFFRSLVTFCFLILIRQKGLQFCSCSRYFACVYILYFSLFSYSWIVGLANGSLTWVIKSILTYTSKILLLVYMECTVFSFSCFRFFFCSLIPCLLGFFFMVM